MLHKYETLARTLLQQLTNCATSIANISIEVLLMLLLLLPKEANGSPPKLEESKAPIHQNICIPVSRVGGASFSFHTSRKYGAWAGWLAMRPNYCHERSLVLYKVNINKLFHLE
jgi:hypothetical protein